MTVEEFKELIDYQRWCVENERETESASYVACRLADIFHLMASGFRTRKMPPEIKQMVAEFDYKEHLQWREGGFRRKSRKKRK